MLAVELISQATNVVKVRPHIHVWLYGMFTDEKGPDGTERVPICDLLSLRSGLEGVGIG